MDRREKMRGMIVVHHLSHTQQQIYELTPGVSANVLFVPTVGVLLGVGAAEGDEVSSLLLVLAPDEL